MLALFDGAIKHCFCHREACLMLCRGWAQPLPKCPGHLVASKNALRCILDNVRRTAFMSLVKRFKGEVSCRSVYDESSHVAW